MAEAVAAVYALRYLDIVQQRAMRRERVFRDRTNALELDDATFRQLFRLPKPLMLELVDSLRGVLPQPRRSAMPLETKVLAAVRFYATGSYQRCIGQEGTISLSQRSVSKCVTEVSKAIAEYLLPQWIQFPRSQAELTTVRTGFMDKYKFPGVVGAIDCTHVAIVAPVTDAENLEGAFVNRKGFHSINVQMVCDSRMRILNINARYPGSCHDAFIWSVSDLRQRFVEADEQGTIGNSWLIGDTGYALEPWLLTPIPDAMPGSGENAYNVAHSKLRNTVECCYGLLKQVWRCTLKHRVLHYCPSVAGDIIVTCAVLHNMFVHNNIPLPDVECDTGAAELPEEQVAEVRQRGNPLATKGKKLQEKLIRNYFAPH